MKTYKAENIKILTGLDAVRKVPAMYIGNTAVEGLHHLIYELVDNSVDEALEGYCDRITIILHRDYSVTCEDNGRGIPIEIYKEEGVPALEIVLTKLHAGGKFDKESYRYSAGLHGVGLSVVNALSEYLEVEIRRDGKVYFQRYERGNKVTELEIIGDTDKTGTKIRFKPDKTIFESTEFVYEIIAQRMREISFLNNGIHIMLIDEKRGKRQEFKHEGGVKAFVKFLNTNKTPLFEEPIYITGTRPGLDAIEVALQYNDGYNENICSYVNNINTKEGGSHVAGFKSALTRCINNFIQNYLPQKNKETVTGDDVKEGLVAVISIKIPNPQFEGQTKTKLGNSEIKGIVESLLNERLTEYLELNPNIGKIIAQKALDAKRARDAAKRAKELVKNKSLIESGVLPGKLADCQESNPELCEIFIVEGDSAGGSAKQGRDRRIQAILPLKGKILNVEKSRDEKILTNQEIRSIYLATGLNTENGARPRYKKIIIMTDADVDGSHIRTLLLTLFYRRASELITNGYLYIAQPPLYKIRHGNKSEVYIKDETEFEDFITLRGIEKIRFYIEDTEQTKVQLKEAAKTIQRLEHYFNAMEKVDTERTTLLGLFGADIKGREDFKVEERLETVARFLKERGYKADIKRDKEHNLYSITVVNDHGTQTIDYEFCEQDDYIEAYDNYKKVKAFYERPIFIMENDQKRQIKDIKEFMRLISEKGKEGLNIQRYKGLGEMNPEQLWETTMDPEKRKLIRVTIEDAVEADQIFTVLMGNNIETRRAFIEENATYVRNLDI